MPSPYVVTNPLGIQYSYITPLFPEWILPGNPLPPNAAIDAFNIRVDALYLAAVNYVSVTGWGAQAQYAVTLFLLHLMKVDPRGQILEDHVDQISQSFSEFKDKKLTVYAVLFEELRAANKPTFQFFGV